MARPREHKNNAARQKAYRERKKAGVTTPRGKKPPSFVDRVLSADRQLDDFMGRS